MKKLFFLLSLSFSLTTFSQITIVRSDYGFPGDKIFYAVDTPVSSSITLGPSGANRTWNYATLLQANQYDSTQFFTTVGDPNAPAGTNLRVMTSNSVQYQQVDTNAIRLNFDNPTFGLNGMFLKIIQFPLTYLSTVSDSNNFSSKGTLAQFGFPAIPGFDSARIDGRIHVTSFCDGWGTITLPDTSCSSLRLVTNSNVNVDVYLRSIIGTWSLVGNQKQNGTDYQWLAKNGKSFIARAALDTLGNITSFTYRTKKVVIPKVTFISPNSGQKGQVITVSVKGTNTHFTQGTVSLYLQQGTNAMAGTSVYVMSDTTLTASITISQANPVGLYDLIVTDPIFGNMTLPASFLVSASANLPKLVSVSPASANKGQKLYITLNASATHFLNGSNFVNFQLSGVTTTKITADTITVLNDSTLKCYIHVDSTATSGTYTILVKNYIDDTFRLYNSFSVMSTGIADAGEALSTLRVYPNPASHSLVISGSRNLQSVMLYDLAGKLQRQVNSASTQATLDVADLREGIYFCVIKGEGYSTTRKISISR